MERLLLFPEPFPGESFYSLTVRYHRLVVNDSYRITSQELFGSYSRTCGSVLPCCLGALSQNLEGLYSVRQLINSSTLLPLYQPFLSNDTYEAAIAYMTSAQGTGLKMKLGLTASGFLRYSSFRYCESCLKADTESYGAAYWHRIHMATGICVCPHHGEVLLSANFANSSDWRCMLLPSEITGTHTLEMGEMAGAFALAEMQLWALENPSRIVNLLQKNILIQRLIELDLYKAGRIKEMSLRELIARRLLSFPQNSEFQCVTSGCDWALQLLHRRNRANQPFRFYFLCCLLGFTVNDLAGYELKEQNGHFDNNHIHPLRKNLPSSEEVEQRRSSFIADTRGCCRDKTGYSWLYHHDRAWLKEYIVSHGFKRAPKNRVDWVARDKEVALKLTLARDNILLMDGKPIKVTQASLVKYAGYSYEFRRQKAKFPESISLMGLILESEHDYQIRKITWSVGVYSLSPQSAISVILKFSGIRVMRVTELEITNILSSANFDYKVGKT